MECYNVGKLDLWHPRNEICRGPYGWEHSWWIGVEHDNDFRKARRLKRGALLLIFKMLRSSNCSSSCPRRSRSSTQGYHLMLMKSLYFEYIDVGSCKKTSRCVFAVEGNRITEKGASLTAAKLLSHKNTSGWYASTNRDWKYLDFLITKFKSWDADIPELFSLTSQKFKVFHFVGRVSLSMAFQIDCLGFETLLQHCWLDGGPFPQSDEKHCLKAINACQKGNDLQKY